MFYEFKQNLKNEIEKSVIGKVHVNVTNNKLIVDIYAVNMLVYHYYYSHFADGILDGLSSREAAQLVVNDYRNYIYRLYFKRKQK